MLLFIDNFDSFTYNLVQCFRMLGETVVVVQEGSKSYEECLALKPDGVIIGPGPGKPSQAYLSKRFIASNLPLFGVCLGHQALAEYYGGNVVKAMFPMHGKQSAIYHTGTGLFEGIKQGFLATRYHSLVVQKESLPPCVEVTAWTEEGEVMALQVRGRPQLAVQFHPESVLTEEGMRLFLNHVRYTNRKK